MKFVTIQVVEKEGAEPLTIEQVEDALNAGCWVDQYRVLSINPANMTGDNYPNMTRLPKNWK
jgi:hypothetical protein